jgi:uncharacterized membrane protein
VADLVVLGYPDEPTAKVVYLKVEELQRELIIDGTAAVLTRSADGRIHVETPTGAVGSGAAAGALWGGLFGLLFLVPVGGLILGGIMGAMMGKLADAGIDDEFRAQVQAVLQPGRSAVVLIFTKVTPDKALAALAPYGGEVLQTSLTKETEDEISMALQPAAPAAG